MKGHISRLENLPAALFEPRRRAKADCCKYLWLNAVNSIDPYHRPLSLVFAVRLPMRACREHDQALDCIFTCLIRTIH